MTNWEGMNDVFDELDEVVETGESPAPASAPTTVLDDIDGQEPDKQDADEPTPPAPVTIDDIDNAEEEDKDNKESDENTKKLLKATAIYKAEKWGIDVSQVEDWTEDTFAALEDQIDELRFDQKYNEAKQSNPVIEALLEVAENGGDLNDILSLFEQQKEFADIDTSTIEGKIEKIKKYYKDIENKPASWIERYVKKLQVSDDTTDIEDEFNSVTEQEKEFFEKEKDARVEQAAIAKQQKEAKLKKQITDFTTTLDEQKLPKAKSKELLDFVFAENFVVRGTDERVSGFQVEIAKAKNDPKRLMNIALFLKDEKAYQDRIITEYNNKKNEAQFSAILKKEQSTSSTESNKQPTKVQFKIP